MKGEAPMLDVSVEQTAWTSGLPAGRMTWLKAVVVHGLPGDSSRVVVVSIEIPEEYDPERVIVSINETDMTGSFRLP